jgi:serine/threonine-protein kinase
MEVMMNTNMTVREGISSFLFAALLVFALASIVDAKEDNLRAALELVQEDSLVISPEQVIEECCKVLTSSIQMSSHELEVVYKRRGEAYLRLGNTEKAKSDFDYLVKLRPDDPIPRCKQACCLPKPEDRLLQLKIIIREFPKCARAYTAAAIELGKIGELDQAINYSSQAIAINSQYPYAFLIRAMTCRAKEDWTHCYEDITTFINLLPFTGLENLEGPYILRGAALGGMGRFREAVPNYLMAIKLNSSNTEAHYGLFQSYFMMSKYHAASVVAERWVSIEPKSSKALLACASCYSQIGRLEEAIKMVESAILLNPGSSSAVFLLAQALSREGQFDKSVTQFNKALELDPSNEAALLEYSLFLSTCPDPTIRNGEKGKKLAKKLCDLRKGKDCSSLMALAAAEAECGNFDEASKIATRCLEMKGQLKEFEKVSVDLWRKQLELYRAHKPSRLERVNPKMINETLKDDED